MARNFIILAMVVGFLTVSGLPGSSAAALVAYYPFDGDANDASGSGHDATEVLATAAAGKFGGAYYFDGHEDSYIKVPNSSDFDIETDRGFTIAFWVLVEPSVAQNQFSVVDYHENWNIRGDEEDPADPSLPRFLWFSAGTEAGFQGTFATPPFGAWHHVAWKFEDEGDQYALSGFTDGQLDSFSTFAGTLVSGTGDLYFGKSGLGASAPFKGYLDDVRIYNTALSDDDILSLSQLNPVPLPGSLFLVGSGLLALMGFSRFRN